MDLENFKKLTQKMRPSSMPSALQLVNSSFETLQMHEKETEYFEENASDFILDMRAQSWKTFLQNEKEFNAQMAKLLVEQSNIDTLTSILENDELPKKEQVYAIIKEFTKNFDQHIYALNLSSTQSRRSRAGKEFEHIIYKLLLNNKIFYDDQGVTGNERFNQAGLGKLVDCVVPGVEEYNILKRKCALISMKTTLRERWAEVQEEMARTGAQSMYLLTLDKEISDDVINKLYGHNVHLVVLDSEKNEKYNRNSKVMGISQLLAELQGLMDYWKNTKAHEFNLNYFSTKIEMYQFKRDNTNLQYEKRIFRNAISYFEEGKKKLQE